MDLIELELMWSSLRSIVNAQAKAMQRAAFSAIVREAGDLAYGLFDARGRTVAQAETGTPGHINCLAAIGLYLAETFKGDLKPGDMLITNDPWLSAGHHFDFTVFFPIFMEDRIIGYVGSTNHHTDVGGLGVGVSATDVHEEGIWVPPMKLFEEDRPNKVLLDLIRRNIRTPDLFSGDLAAQVSANRSGAIAVVELCRRYNIPDIEALSDAIIQRSERAMRDCIRRCPSGTWSGSTEFDIPTGEIIKLQAQVTIDNKKGEVLVDFAGSSPQMRRGVNAVLNYTHAYATFTVRGCLGSEIPNNSGSLEPIKVTAPSGSVVNCEYPAPVAGRHIVGQCTPMPILRALYQAVPDCVIAPGSGAGWNAQVVGHWPNGQPFDSSLFSFAGGMGARATKDGPSATYFPSGVGTVPLEILEADTPIVFRRRELRHGSGGRGRTNGGDGQIVEFGVRTNRPWTLNFNPNGLKNAPEGLAGSIPAKSGVMKVNGEDRVLNGKMLMQPNDVIYFETPGAAGIGKPV